MDEINGGMEMKVAKAVKIFGQRIIDEEYVVPIELAEHRFFGSGCSGNYRVEAIKFCVEKKLPIENTNNNTYELVPMFIKIKCPYCNGTPKLTSGSGCGESHTNHYRCKCGAEVSLTLRDGDFKAEAKEVE